MKHPLASRRTCKAIAVLAKPLPSRKCLGCRFGKCKQNFQKMTWVCGFYRFTSRCRSRRASLWQRLGQDGEPVDTQFGTRPPSLNRRRRAFALVSEERQLASIALGRCHELVIEALASFCQNQYNLPALASNTNARHALVAKSLTTPHLLEDYA